MAECTIEVAPTRTGCVLRVNGRGTMRESRAARDIALRTIRGNAAVVVDLSKCTYLDSTFLGGLLDLFRAAGSTGNFSIAAPAERRTKLLGTLRLDRVFPSMEVAPDTVGPWVAVSTEGFDKQDIARHVMQCHRQLAELDTPMRAVFAHIADEMAKELP